MSDSKNSYNDFESKWYEDGFSKRKKEAYRRKPKKAKQWEWWVDAAEEEDYDDYYEYDNH